jgi:hypothetical protein
VTAPAWQARQSFTQWRKKMTDEKRTELDLAQLVKAQSFAIKTIIAVLDGRHPEMHLADEMRSAAEKPEYSEAFRDTLKSILPARR